MNTTLGKFLYGILFCVVLPVLLVVWAQALALRLPALPPVAGWAVGWALVVGGGVLLLWGMWDLWSIGGGLPMTAFPPPRYVARGLYGWLPHPIYLGFALLMPGAFVAADMPAGVWIVSPVIWLGTIALVVGHERIDLQKRFGGNRERPRLALPPDEAAPPQWWHRGAVYALLLGPWVAAYQGVARLLDGQKGFETYLPFEHAWPTLAGTGAVYAGAFAWVALAPLAATSQAALRRLIRDGWAGAAFLLWCYLVLPLTATPRATNLLTPFGPWFDLDHSPDPAWCTFPSAHMVWALLAARVWAGRVPAPVAYGLAALMAASGVTTGRNSVLGIVAGLAVFAAVQRLDDLWRRLLGATEQVANSWRDWRLGKVRVINHGAYVSVAAGAGLWLVGVLLGERYSGAILIVGCCSLLGAGIWAQLLESSSGLSRPFGYYGGIFGGWLGVGAVQLWRGEGWMLMGAFAVTSALVQGTGRLRCLVQGCCHGRPCPDHLGIRYHQPLSRVCKLARWAGTPIYPTPLYSIIGNVVILGLLLRLWFAGADVGFITGTALILSACARFMEEGYRGEPQTARFGGLAIYQWLALLFVIGGAVCMVVPTPAAPVGGGGGAQPLLYAVPFGLLVWFAMGVDFPESNRRFSRLA